MELDPSSVVALLQWATCRGMPPHLGITHTWGGKRLLMLYEQTPPPPPSLPISHTSEELMQAFMKSQRPQL